MILGGTRAAQAHSQSIQSHAGWRPSPEIMQLVRPLTLLALSWLLRETARGAQATDDRAGAAGPRMELPVVVVWGRASETGAPADVSATLGTPLDPMRVPLSASVVDQGLSEAQGNLTLTDALHNVPGVTVGKGNGIFDSFTLRGVDSLTGGQILVDGIPDLAAPFYPLHQIDRVEVLKGPGSFLFGPYSLVGSVNLVRKEPMHESGTAYRLGLGSHDRIRMAVDAQDYWKSPGVDLRLNGLYEEAGSHRDGIRSSYEAVNPAVRVPWNETDSLSVLVDLERSRPTPDAGIPVLGDTLPVDSISRTFQEPDDDSEQNVARALIRYENQFHPDWKLLNRTYYNQLDWTALATAYAGFVPFAMGLEPGPVTLARYRPSLDDRQAQLGNDLELHGAAGSGAWEHQLLLGLDAYRRTDEFTILSPPAESISILDGTRTPAFLPPVPDQRGDATIDDVGLYGFDQVQISRRWSVLVGGRGDWLDFQDDSQGTDRTDSMFSPMGGITFSATDAVALFANGGMGFSPPSTRVQGPRGEPEESRQVEAGARWAFPEEAGYVQLAGFQLQRDNIAIPTSLGLTEESGEQESTGLELELARRWNENFQTQVAYSYLESELTRFSETLGERVMDQSGNTAPFSPEHLLNAWLEYFLASGWGVGVGGRLLSEQFIAPDNRFAIDAYGTLDAALYYRADTWHFAVNVFNLTDETYYGRGTGGTSVIPGDGTSVMAYFGLDL